MSQEDCMAAALKWTCDPNPVLQPYLQQNQSESRAPAAE